MDKNKIIEAATKFVQKGQYDKAIKEYLKLLEADPKDSRLLQKVGELYQKKGDNSQAAEYFLKVGESYSGDGFFLKAVAVYKQVLKLDEKRIDVNLKLAELYQQLGLMSDAMAQLQIVSAHYEKTGNSQASLDLLKRMVELDPDNIASRIKLAELYARDNLNGEAVSEFTKAASYLKRNNRIDDYIKVAERLVFLDPNNVELARELAQIYLAKQDTKRALVKLQVCFKADPRDVETLNLLAQAFLELGQTSKTISVYKELAKLYDEQDRVDDERAIWEKIRDIAPDDPDVQKHLAPPMAASASTSYEAVAPAAPARGAAPAAAAPAGGPVSPEQIAKLLTETDVYVKYGLHDKAMEHLKKVFAADPNNLDGHDKAYTLAKSSGQNQRAEEELILVIRLAIEAGDWDRARARLQTLLESNPGHPEVEGFLAAIGQAPAVEAEVVEEVDESVLIESEEAEVIEEEAAAVELEPASDEMLATSDDEVLATADDEALAAAASGDDELLATSDEPLADEVVAEEYPAEVSNSAVLDEALVAAASDEQLVPDDGLLPEGRERYLTGSDEPIAAESSGSFEVLASDDAALAAASSSSDELVAADDFTADEVVSGGDDGAQSTMQYADADALMRDAAASMEDRATADEDVFAVPSESAVVEDVNEVTSEQSQLDYVPPIEEPLEDAAVVSDEEFEPRDQESATRVVNLADLAQMEHKATVAKMAAAPPEAVSTAARITAARPGTQPTANVDPSAGARTIGADVRNLAKGETKPAVKMEPARAARPPSSIETAAAAVEVAEPEYTAPEAEAAPEEDPAGDELEEAAFFISQGDLETARDILETVLLAYPKNARAKELMTELEAKESGGGEEAPPVTQPETAGDQSFDLAAELAEELGDAPAAEESQPLAPGEDGFQISHEDVFAEFKKGVAKVVKPEDVETHYDLGVAYKEMGLLNDAVGEFEQALQGATGKPREVDCCFSIGECKRISGDNPGAIEAWRRGLALPQISPDATKAMLYEIATTYEGMGNPNRALSNFKKVAALDPKFRDALAQAKRLEADGATPEDEPRGNGHLNGKAHGAGMAPAAKEPPPAGGAKGASRKIGYV